MKYYTVFTCLWLEP